MQINYKNKQIVSIIAQGIPSIYRNKIWLKLINNVHGITINFYQLLNKKAALYLNASYQDVQPEKHKMLKQLNIIQKDIERTFPQLKVFRRDSDQGQYLFNILTSWTVFRQDIGYIQGMSQIAGMLLLQLKQTQQIQYKYRAFLIFCSLMTLDTLYTYYTMDINEMKKIQQNFQYRLRKGDEKLYSRLNNVQIDTRIILLNWIMTLFTKVMDLDVVGRLWDILLLTQLSQKIIIQICYQLLLIFKQQIMNEELECQQILAILKSSRINQLDSEQLIDNIKNIFF